MTVPTREELDAALEAEAITMALSLSQTVELAYLLRGHDLLAGLDPTALVAGVKLGMRIVEGRQKGASNETRSSSR